MIAIAADLHLWPHVWRSVRSLEGDAFRAFDEIVDRILEAPDAEKAFIMAGDIFDEPKVEGLTLKTFADGMSRLLDAGVKVYHVDGNHDKGKESIPSIHGSISLHRNKVAVDGRTVVGLNWMPKEQLRAELSELPAADILVLHCRMEHLTGFVEACDISVEEIPDHFSSIIAGDIHVTGLEELENGFCLSPGSPHPCSLSETGEHGFWILRGEMPEFQPVRNRKIVRVEISSDDELDRFRELLAGYEQFDAYAPLVEVSYAPEYLGRISDIAEQMSDRVKHLFRRRKTGDSLISGAQAASDMKEGWKLGLLESLPFAVDEGKSPELYQLLSTLLAFPPQDKDDNIKEYLEAYCDS